MAAITKRYFLIRTAQTIFMFWVVVTILFFLFRLAPGDFTDLMMFSGADQETIEAFEKEWGLDQPLYVQYFQYISNLIQGDAGVSLQYRRPVWDVVATSMFNSFILVAPAVTTAYILGSIYGLVAGMNRGAWFERHGIVVILFLGAFPAFFIAIMLMIIFAGWLDIFPTSGIISTDTRRAYSEAPWWRIYFTFDFIWHYALPFTAIVQAYLFLPSLIMRTSTVEVRGQGFSYYQRIAGIPKRERLQTIAKHASLPVITLYATSLAQAVGGLVLVEIVFNWPGIGYTLVQGVFARDFPLIMFVFFVIAVFIILANYVVDILYGVIDPRVTVGE